MDRNQSFSHKLKMVKKMVDENLQKLVDAYAGARDNLLDSLEELPNWMSNCDCPEDENNDVINIHDPSRDKDGEYLCICLKCGGDVNLY